MTFDPARVDLDGKMDDPGYEPENGYEVTDARLDEQRRLYKGMLKYLGQRHAPSVGNG